jgi:hypothetical protein
MTIHLITAHLMTAARIAIVALALAAVFAPADAGAQGRSPAPPAANSIALAKEIMTLKGALPMYESVIPATIEQTKTMMLRTNPMLSKDLNDVATKLRTELARRGGDLFTEVAKLYASRFTEAELKDALAFYKTPLGRKIIVEEPRIIDDSIELTQSWQEKFGEEVISKIRVEMKKKGHDL